MRAAVLIIFFYFIHGFSETMLHGELKGILRKDKYVITGTIIIKPGDTLVVDAGSELRFQPMSGIQIKGVFIADGTKENAILCASLRNSLITAEDSSPYNWSGLRVMDTAAALRLSYVLLCDAGTAIDLQCRAREISFDHVVFHKNGFLNLICQGKPLGLPDDVEYAYRGTGREMILGEDSAAPVLSGVQGVSLPKSAKIRWYVPLRVSLSCVALAGAGFWLGGGLQAQQFDRQYHEQKTIRVGR